MRTNPNMCTALARDLQSCAHLSSLSSVLVGPHRGEKVLREGAGVQQSTLGRFRGIVGVAHCWEEAPSPKTEPITHTHTGCALCKPLPPPLSAFFCSFWSFFISVFL